MIRLFLLLFLLLLPTKSWSQQRLSIEIETRLDSLVKASERALAKGRWTETYAIAHRYCEIADTTQCTETLGRMLSYLAREASESGNRQQAVALARRAVDVRLQSTESSPIDLATAYNDLAAYYKNIGNLDEAIRYGLKACDVLKRIDVKKYKDVAIIFSNVESMLLERNNEGDCERAVELGELASTLVKDDSPVYYSLRMNLAIVYTYLGQHAKADALMRETLKKGRKTYANSPETYAVMLTNYAAQLASQHAYAGALLYADEAKANYEKAGATHSIPFAKMLVNRAVVLTGMERYAESVATLDTALLLLGQLVQPSNEDYIRCLSELSVAYNKMGNSEKAEEYSSQVEQAVGNTNDDLSTAHRLVKQAEIIAHSGDWNRALLLEQRAAAVFHRRLLQEEEARSMCNMATYLVSMRNYTAAHDSIQKALSLFENTQGHESLCADLYSTLAMAWHYLQNEDSALICAHRSVELCKEDGDTLSSSYSKSLGNLALYTYMAGDTVRALYLAERAKEIQLSVLGLDHPDNAALLYNLARYYCGVDADKVQYYYHLACVLQEKMVRSNFSHLTSVERENYWNTKSYLFKASPYLAYMYPHNDSILADAYNVQLFTKGLLLNSEVNFRDFLLQAGDSVLLANYDRLALLNRELNDSYRLPFVERKSKIEGLTEEMSKIEKRLIRDCKRFGDFMAGLNGDLEQVSDALAPDEVAIELLNLQVGGIGETYLALFLKKNWKLPRCQVLFSEYEMHKRGYTMESISQLLSSRQGIDSLYHDVSFGNLVWGHLLPHIEGVHTVYFAPSGMFYQLGAENLRVDSIGVFSQHFVCHRLSSTRLVAEHDMHDHFESASVFGGLLYDMTKEEICKAHEQFASYDFSTGFSSLDTYDLVSMLVHSENSSLRSGAEYLPYTQAEALQVGEHLMQHNIHTNMFEAQQGTEEAFKALSGKHQSIIHLATHGFTIKGETDKSGAFEFRIADLRADDPLCRQGILMAGANYSLKGGILPDGLENGVFTAREISSLDLSGASLVTLSACGTGLGEVREDGVFGLQRGFKKAGAKTLLMSLWKVDDQATMVMMSAFYEKLMQGASKHDAFIYAQTAVRAAGFDEPFYWASFIMLDDL